MKNCLYFGKKLHTIVYTYITFSCENYILCNRIFRYINFFLLFLRRNFFRNQTPTGQLKTVSGVDAQLREQFTLTIHKEVLYIYFAGTVTAVSTALQRVSLPLRALYRSTPSSPFVVSITVRWLDRPEYRYHCDIGAGAENICQNEICDSSPCEALNAPSYKLSRACCRLDIPPTAKLRTRFPRIRRR